MTANPIHPDPADLAAMYVSGALDAEERQGVDAELAKGNLELTQAIADLSPAVHGLLDAAPAIAPTASVRDETLKSIERIADERQAAHQHEPAHDHVWDAWTDDSASGLDLFTLASDEGSWEPTGVEGVDVRRLFVDKTNQRMTVMFRMAPGSHYVPHVHDEAEECYVLSGDLHVGDELIMHAGDYQRAAPGSVHGVQRTVDGCVLLVNCSLHDEPV